MTNPTCSPKSNEREMMLFVRFVFRFGKGDPKLRFFWVGLLAWPRQLLYVLAVLHIRILFRPRNSTPETFQTRSNKHLFHEKPLAQESFSRQQPDIRTRCLQLLVTPKVSCKLPSTNYISSLQAFYGHPLGCTCGVVSLSNARTLWTVAFVT